jgi:hypothetical protein
VSFAAPTLRIDGLQSAENKFILLWLDCRWFLRQAKGRWRLECPKDYFNHSTC